MNSPETQNQVELLKTRMDTSSLDKVGDIKLCIDSCRELPPNPRILSLGAGTGKVERQIAIDYPKASVTAIDFSLPMIEEIQKNAVLPEQGQNLSIVRGQIGRLPFRQGTFDVIIASSVVHEVTSSRDNRKLGIHTKHLFQQIGEGLTKNGIFILRDFVQPDLPGQLVALRIGKIIEQGDVDPLRFVDRFSQEFKGIDFTYLRLQILSLKQRKAYNEGSLLYLPYADAIELGAHYSWARRFEDEVKERYSYLPILDYQLFIQKNFREAGVNTRMRARYSYLQPGYPQHINGRLDLFVPISNKPMHLSPFTGVLAFQRTN